MNVEYKVLEAFISAVEQVGEDGAGKDGIAGFLLKGAKSDPNSFAETLVGGLPYENPSEKVPSKDPVKARKGAIDLPRRR